MLGPIPNSLGAGAYNGSFLPHGLVTFSSRGNIVIIFQEICVDAGVVTTKSLIALMSATQAVAAGFIDAVPVEAGVVTSKSVDGGRVITIALIGGIEDC